MCVRYEEVQTPYPCDKCAFKCDIIDFLFNIQISLWTDLIDPFPKSFPPDHLSSKPLFDISQQNLKMLVFVSFWQFEDTFGNAKNAQWGKVQQNLKMSVGDFELWSKLWIQRCFMEKRRDAYSGYIYLPRDIYHIYLSRDIYHISLPSDIYLFQ